MMWLQPIAYNENPAFAKNQVKCLKCSSSYFLNLLDKMCHPRTSPNCDGLMPEVRGQLLHWEFWLTHENMNLKRIS